MGEKLVAGKAYMSTNLKGEEKKKRDKTMARGVGMRPWWLVGASMVPFLPPTPRDTAVFPHQVAIAATACFMCTVLALSGACWHTLEPAHAFLKLKFQVQNFGKTMLFRVQMIDRRFLLKKLPAFL
jgi:hypothetical protein